MRYLTFLQENYGSKKMDKAKAEARRAVHALFDSGEPITRESVFKIINKIRIKNG